MTYSLQLSGRLGNQLFQWSYAHNLSLQTGEKVDLFTDKFHTTHADELIENLICEHTKFVGLRNSLGRQLQIFDWIGSRSFAMSNSLAAVLDWDRTKDAYSARLNSFSKSRYSGFYQDYRQVINVLPFVLPELERVSQEYIESAQSKINLPNSYQFAHIRRGDLVNSSALYGLLNLNWYAQHRKPELPLVISTDDLDNSEQIIHALRPDFILSPHEFSAAETLFVMGQAKDLIMANSTLSWWGGLIAGQKAANVHFPDPYYIGNSILTEKLCGPGFKNSPSGL